MTCQIILDVDDPRLDPYRSLKTAKLHRRGGLFVAEGDKVVERLLASEYEVVSILVSEQRSAQFGHLSRPDLITLVVQDKLASQLVGFKFHAGVMACGRRKPQPDLERIASGRLLVGCAQVDDPENLGSIIRLSAVFGVEGLMLGPGCPDPFSRRVLRVSMGNGFSIPIHECRNLQADLSRLRSDFGFELIATVASANAEPLDAVSRPDRAIILFGNEAHGLNPDLIQACDRRITVPMRSGADSLNVGVAAGIILYQFRELTAHFPVPPGTRRDSCKDSTSA